MSDAVALLTEINSQLQSLTTLLIVLLFVVAYWFCLWAICSMGRRRDGGEKDD